MSSTILHRSLIGGIAVSVGVLGAVYFLQRTFFSSSPKSKRIVDSPLGKTSESEGEMDNLNQEKKQKLEEILGFFAYADEKTTESIRRHKDDDEKRASFLTKSKPHRDIKHSGVVTVVLGCQFGDEGKGKVIDYFSSPDFNNKICARYSGGANAGHTVIVNDETHKFHLMPSAALHNNMVCVLGHGMVIDLFQLEKEFHSMMQFHYPDACFDDNYDFLNNQEINVKVSLHAHLVFSFHKQIDADMENFRSSRKLGTTKRGIGPAYSSKVMRHGVRVVDLVVLTHDQFEEKVVRMFDELSHCYGDTMFQLKESEMRAELALYRREGNNTRFSSFLRLLVTKLACETTKYMHNAVWMGHNVLVEGANATMLDIDFGWYPYVTSCNTTIGGVFTGLGVNFRNVNEVIGVIKAYTTRVGEGPFPTQMPEDVQRYIRAVGKEQGTTTGRDRRCGYLDIPQIRYSCNVNGISSLAMMKLDVLTGIQPLVIGYRYVDGHKSLTYPRTIEDANSIDIMYDYMEGWNEPISDCRRFEDLPEACQKYVEKVEKLLRVPIVLLGVGPDRDAMIVRF